jgi:hypothetical protein
MPIARGLSTKDEALDDETIARMLTIINLIKPNNKVNAAAVHGQHRVSRENVRLYREGLQHGS